LSLNAVITRKADVEKELKIARDHETDMDEAKQGL
jgi:hypothetical protein